MTDHTLFNRRNTSHADGSGARAATDGSDGLGGAPSGAQDAGADEPAHLDGYGPIPADLARRLIADAPAGTKMELRRLYTDPESAALVAMESSSRCFSDQLRQFLVLRDQICPTPWCNAAIRHADHVLPAADGGPTSADNGQGLCEVCNYAKQAHGWQASPAPDGAGHTVTITTPTAHTYTSRAPTHPAAHRPTAAHHRAEPPSTAAPDRSTRRHPPSPSPSCASASSSWSLARFSGQGWCADHAAPSATV